MYLRFISPSWKALYTVVRKRGSCHGRVKQKLELWRKQEITEHKAECFLPIFLGVSVSKLTEPLSFPQAPRHCIHGRWGVGSMVNGGIRPMGDGGVGSMVDRGVGSMVDGGVGFMVDRGVWSMVDGGIGLLVDGGFGSMVDGGIGSMVDGGVGSMVEAE